MTFDAPPLSPLPARWPPGLSPGESAALIENTLRLIRKVKPSLAATEFTAATRFDDLGVDSLHFISILFELEEFFRISIVDRNLDDIETFGEACATVARLVVEKSREERA